MTNIHDTDGFLSFALYFINSNLFIGGVCYGKLENFNKLLKISCQPKGLPSTYLASKSCYIHPLLVIVMFIDHPPN